MINKKAVVIIIILLVAFMVGVPLLLTIYKKNAPESTIVTGLTEGQQKTFHRDLSDAIKQYSYIKKGDKLLAEGHFDNALSEYKMALASAKSAGTKGEAFRSLANLYEKKREYEKALEYVIILRDNYVATWALEPFVERAKYLEYACKGNYDLSVEHARKAIKAEANLPDSNGNPRLDYVQRLNDIISSKGYIMSLKKQE